MLPRAGRATVGELLATSKFIHTLERCKADSALVANRTFQAGTGNRPRFVVVVVPLQLLDVV